MVLFVTGCQTLDSTLPADWVMRGTLIIRTPERAERVNVAWRQLSGQSEILLTGPLGASIARIAPQAGSYALERPGEETLVAANLESLVDLAIGQALPVSAVVPILSGKRRQVNAAPWQLTTREIDAEGRAKKIFIAGNGITMTLTVRSWG